MVEKNKMILALIDDGYSIQEIRKKLDIDYRELNTRLNQIRRCGYEFLSSYDNNGKINFLINRGTDIYNEEGITTINALEKVSNFRFIATSDTHYGHKRDCIEMLYNLYDYASKNGIHNIFNAGDLIEGDYTNKDYMRNKSIETQLNYIIKNYPYDDEIVNYILGGNHDYHSLIESGLNIFDVLKSRRYDFVCLGYGLHTLRIKNVNISMKHYLPATDLTAMPPSDIVLAGHSHISKMEFGNRAVLTLPSCSLIGHNRDKNNKDEVKALDINIKFQNTTSRVIEINELQTLPKVKVLNNITYRIEQVKNNRRNGINS